MGRMITRRLIAWVCMAGMPCIAGAQDRSTDHVWAAPSVWSVSDTCSISGTFTSDRASLIVTYSPAAGATAAKIVLSSDDPTLSPGSSGILTILPAGQASALSAVSPTRGRTVVLTTVGPANPADFASASEVRVSLDGGFTIQHPLGSAGKRVADLVACQDAFRRSGHDFVDRVAVRADQGAGVMTPNDYPRDALRANAEGRVVSLATFDQSGKPMRCETLRSSGHDTLDRKSCDLITRRLRIDPSPTGSDRRWTIFPMNWTLGG